MKAAGLRDLTYEQLTERLDEAKEDLFNLRFQLATSQSDNTARTGGLRREIARIKTVLGEWDREGRPRDYEDYREYEDYEEEPPQPAEPAVADEAVAEAQPADEEEVWEEEPVAPEEPVAEEPDETEEEETPQRGRRWSRRSKK